VPHFLQQGGALGLGKAPKILGAAALLEREQMLPAGG